MQIGPSFTNTRSVIFDLIRSSGTVNRVDLAQMTGLTPATITRTIKSLIEEGVVTEVGLGASTGGKRPSLIEVNAGAGYAVGVLVDVEQISYVVTDLAGDVLGRDFSAGNSNADPAEVMTRVRDEILQLCEDLEISVSDVVGVGIADAGLNLGPARTLSSTTGEWEEFAVAEALSRDLGVPVVRENDAACAALGHFWNNQIPATRTFATLYLASGFGLGMVFGGQLFRGASWNAGEVGHVVIDVNGPECVCGARGCLETLAAPSAIVSAAFEDPEYAASLGLKGSSDALRSDFALIQEAAKTGNPMAVRQITQAAKHIAAAMVSVVNLLDIDHLALAGPGFGSVL